MQKKILKAIPLTLIFAAGLVYAEAPPGRYTVDAERDTVRDERTGLVFSQRVSNERLRYADAEAYCASLEGSYRLPSRAELLSIVDRMTRNPAVDAVFKETTPSDYFWTRTPDPRNVEGSVFRVEFTNGVTSVTEKASAATAYVRCVAN